MQEEFLQQDFSARFMSEAQERALFAAIRKGDRAARSRLLQSGRAFARTLSERYAEEEFTAPFLYDEAEAILLDAVRDYKSACGERFFAYFEQKFKARVRECSRDLAWLLPIDPRLVFLHARYLETLQRLYPASRDPEAVQEEDCVAADLGVSVRTLRRMKYEYAVCRIQSLDQSVALGEGAYDIDDASPLVETVPDPCTEDAAADRLEDLLECLSDAERYALCAREGVLSTPAATDEQIARRLGVDCDGVEALYRTAVEKIRRAGA